MALLTMAMLYGSGLLLGVRLPAERWLVMTGLILAGLIPFAALGVLVGHPLTADTIGWLVQASHVSLGASAWPATGWIMVGGPHRSRARGVPARHRACLSGGAPRAAVGLPSFN